MALKYTPMTEEEIDRLGLLEGQYKFRVIEAEETVNKNGEPQIVLKLRVIADDSPRVIKTYLSTNGQFMLRRLRHFCRATGIMNHYQNQTVNADVCLGLEGTVELGIEKGGDMQDGSGRKYADKTAVVDFIGGEEPKLETEFKDDDIDF